MLLAARRCTRRSLRGRLGLGRVGPRAKTARELQRPLGIFGGPFPFLKMFTSYFKACPAYHLHEAVHIRKKNEVRIQTIRNACRHAAANMVGAGLGRRHAVTKHRVRRLLEPANFPRGRFKHCTEKQTAILNRLNTNECMAASMLIALGLL